MGSTGRIIREHRWPHEFDVYGLCATLADLSYVVDVGDRLVPHASGDLEVTVASGRISIGNARYDFPGGVLSFSDNTGTPYPRYDGVYVVIDHSATPTPVLVKVEGTPAEHPLPPHLPDHLIDTALPVCLVYFRPYIDFISDIVDTRFIQSDSHIHCGGSALDLDHSALKMDVLVDGVTIDILPVEPPPWKLFLMNDAVTWPKIGFSLGVGLSTMEPIPPVVILYTLTDFGIKMEGTFPESMRMDADAVAGEGLTEDPSPPGELMVNSGDGITVDGSGVTLDTGDGFGLLGTTPNRALAVNVASDGGLAFDTTGVGRLRVYADDFAGAGLEGDPFKLLVTPGDGISHVAGRIDVDPDQGLRIHNPGGEPAGDYLLETYLAPGGGLLYDLDGKIYVTFGSFAGDGLFDDAGAISILTGNGFTIGSYNYLTLDLGRGLKMDGLILPERKVAIDDGSGITFGNDMVHVYAGDLTGHGIRSVLKSTPPDFHELAVWSHNGIFVGATTYIDPGHGLDIDGDGKLYVDAEDDLVGRGLVPYYSSPTPPPDEKPLIGMDWEDEFFEVVASSTHTVNNSIKLVMTKIDKEYEGKTLFLIYSISNMPTIDGEYCWASVWIANSWEYAYDNYDAWNYVLMQYEGSHHTTGDDMNVNITLRILARKD